ncbi:WG repeat-containing protein [Orbaceae bacterium ac157xtp]
MKIRHYLLGIGAFLLSSSLYANVTQSNSKSLLVPYKLPNSSYILINQSGELLHPSTQTFSDVTYYPESKIWKARQGFYQPWLEKDTYIDTYFNEFGQIIEINNDDLTLHKLDEKRFIKYSSAKKRYQLIDNEGNVIKQLDPKITWVYPYSSGLAVAQIDIGSGKKPHRYGYIDFNGNWVIQPQYKSANEFDGNFASVELGSNDLIIDKKGTQVFKNTPEIKRYSLSNGFWFNSVARNKGKWFTYEILNPQNKVIAKDLDQPSRLTNNLILLKSGLNDEKYIGILNTLTGEILPTDNLTEAVTYRYSYGQDYSWIKGRRLNKQFYRLVDKNGNTLIENDYRKVYDKFWGYGWVTPDNQETSVLIDVNGNAVTKPYQKYNIINYGDRYYSEAYDNKRFEFLSPKGELIAYTQYFSKIDDIECQYRVPGVFRADDTLIWPKNIRQICLISNEFKFDYSPQVKKEYFQSYVDYIKDRTQNGFWYSHNTVVHGPSNINLDNVATLSLPQGYAWVQDNDVRSYDKCKLGYITPEIKVGDNRWQLCINIGNNIGHVNSASMDSLINNQHDFLQNQLIKTVGRTDYLSDAAHFKWLNKPFYDDKQKTAVWGYELIKELNPSADFSSRTSLIKLGKSKVIWLFSEHHTEAERASRVIQEWGNRIQFNTDQSYELGKSFNCSKLPNGDKTFENMTLYLPHEERCFSYPIDILLTGYNRGNRSDYPNIDDSPLMKFINDTNEVRWINIDSVRIK